LPYTWDPLNVFTTQAPPSPPLVKIGRKLLTFCRMPHSLIVTQNLPQPLMTKSCQEYLSVVGYKTNLFNPIYLLSSFSIVIIGIIADRPIYVTYLLICLLNGLYTCTRYEYTWTATQLTVISSVLLPLLFFVLFFLFRFVVGVVLFNLHFSV
jgi:hypothetical protein